MALRKTPYIYTQLTHHPQAPEHQIQLCQAGATPQYPPYNIEHHHGHSEQPHAPPNHDRMMYPQQTQQFQNFQYQPYSLPQTAEYLYPNNAIILNNQTRSRPTKDASKYAPLCGGSQYRDRPVNTRITTTTTTTPTSEYNKLMNQ